MLFMFQWHIDKLALRVHFGPGFILTSPLNNTMRICLAKNQKPDKKNHSDFVPIIFQSQK